MPSKNRKDKRIKDRGNWGSINPVTKKTPTITERKRKIERKHKKREVEE